MHLSVALDGAGWHPAAWREPRARPGELLTARYCADAIARDRLHYIAFTGRYFSVRGPSITPRPPQGQPVVAALGHGPGPYRLITGSADVGFVTPRDAGHARDIVAGIGSDPVGLAGLAVADLVVFLGATVAEAAARQARMDERAGYAY